MFATRLLLRTLGVALLGAAAALALQAPVPAGRYQLLASRSQLAIVLRKAGLLSALADNHLIVARQMHGAATGGVAGWSGEIAVPVADLQVADPGRSAKDRQEIWTTMESASQLDAAQYPAIIWRLLALAPTPGGFELRGTFTLHGVTRNVAWPTQLSIQAGTVHVWGEAPMRLSDFGITPIRRALGTVRVRDQFELRWDTVWQKQ